jgi:hypothetical protein
MFEETGGSSGGRKLVPYTSEIACRFPQCIAAMAGRPRGELFHRSRMARPYWAISPAVRARRVTADGIVIGLENDAAYFGDALAPLVLDTLAVPPAIGSVENIDSWREATCAHLLACESLGLISVWSPTFLLDLLGYLHDNGGALVARIHAGQFDGLRVSARRATLISEVLGAGHADYRMLWPQLQVVSCWDQAASRPYADALKVQLAAISLQGKGLLATEGSSPFRCAAALCRCWRWTPDFLSFAMRLAFAMMQAK